MSMLQEQAGAQVIRYTTEETSLSSGRAVEDGPRQRSALGLSLASLLRSFIHSVADTPL